MRQLRRWKRLWRRSLTHSHKKTSMGPSRSCRNSTTSALQPEEITSKGTRVSCVYYQKKSGNLLYAPRSLNGWQLVMKYINTLFCFLIDRKLKLSQLIGLMGRVFANHPGDLGSIPGRVIPKTIKMALDTSLLNTQQYKVCIKGKVEQSRERSSTLPYTSV